MVIFLKTNKQIYAILQSIGIIVIKVRKLGWSSTPADIDGLGIKCPYGTKWTSFKYD